MIYLGTETLYYLGRKQGDFTQRSKLLGKHIFITIQNYLTFHSTNCGKYGVLPISEDPRAFMFSWLLLAPNP